MTPAVLWGRRTADLNRGLDRISGKVLLRRKIDGRSLHGAKCNVEQVDGDGGCRLGVTDKPANKLDVTGR